MNKKIKEFLNGHVGSITFTEQKRSEWTFDDKEIGKRHFYFVKSDMADPTNTYCGLNISKKTRIHDGWWGGYGYLFVGSKKNCKVCLKRLRKKMSELK